MPTLRRFASCRVTVYADDHAPPHFHIEGCGFRAVVEIGTMKVRAGRVDKAQEAMSWASANTDLLLAEWRRLKSAELKIASALPRIRAVRAAPKRRLVVTWKNGAESTVDVGDHIARYAIFAPLAADLERFDRVALGEWGWSVGWSEEMEISADTLWRLALEQGSAWLRQWRASRRLTQSEAARALGVSPRMWRYYEAGSHLLPKTVMLAGIGLDALAEAA